MHALMLLKRKNFTKIDWENLVASGNLVRAINAYGTISRILELFKKKTDITIKAAEKFIELNLSEKESFPLDIRSDVTQILANHGLVTAQSNIDDASTTGMFHVTCPLMRSYFGIFLAKCFRPPFPLLPLPFHPLDIPSLLCNVLAHVSTKRMLAAYKFATKTSEIIGITSRERVLKEAVYSQEFASVLTAWFPDTVSISPEVNCGKFEADLFIKYSSFSLTLEFCANARYGPENRPSSFLGHVKRSKIYANSLNSSVCVIHFFGVDNFPLLKKPEDPISPSDDTLSFAYIFHKHDMTDHIQINIWSYNCQPQEYIVKYKDYENDGAIMDEKE